MNYRQKRHEDAKVRRLRDDMDERIIDKWHAMSRHPSTDKALVKQAEEIALGRGHQPYEDGRYERTCLYNYRVLSGGNNG